MHIETPFIHHETLYRLFLFLLPHHQSPLFSLVTGCLALHLALSSSQWQWCVVATQVPFTFTHYWMHLYDHSPLTDQRLPQILLHHRHLLLHKLCQEFAILFRSLTRVLAIPVFHWLLLHLVFNLIPSQPTTTKSLFLRLLRLRNQEQWQLLHLPSSFSSESLLLRWMISFQTLLCSPHGNRPPDILAGKKHHFDDTECLEQSLDLKDGVKNAVAAA